MAVGYTRPVTVHHLEVCVCVCVDSEDKVDTVAEALLL